MSCRRAFEIDLAAFLLAPRDAEWDGFRAHYPGCRACAAEVAAWTALDAALAPPHPDEAELLRWSDHPNALDATARARVARHLERCASCRDELRALGQLPDLLARAAAETAEVAAAPRPAFDAPGVVAPEQHGSHHRGVAERDGRRSTGPERVRPARVRPPRDGAVRRTPLRAARRVLLHPAVAYAALLVVLLLPTFRARFDDVAGRRDFVPAGDIAPQPDAPEPQAAPATRPEAIFRRERFDDRRKDAAEGDQRVNGLEREEAPRAQGPSALADAARDAVETRARQAPKLQADVPPPAAPAAAPPIAQPPAPASAASADAPPAIRLDTATTTGMRTLVVPLPAAALNLVEVRIRDAAGVTELRHKVALAPGAREVTLAIPDAWLVASSYDVEVYGSGAEAIVRGTVVAR